VVPPVVTPIGPVTAVADRVGIGESGNPMVKCWFGAHSGRHDYWRLSGRDGSHIQRDGILRPWITLASGLADTSVRGRALAGRAGHISSRF
jgi:hypothetical protein